MRRLIVLLYLLAPALLSAQRKLDYQLQVKADLAKQSFYVQGGFSFETEAAAADSLDIVISKGVGPVTLQLQGATAVMDTSRKASGDMIYRWHFSSHLPVGTPLHFTCAYERGGAPAFQFYLDSIFCMAGGYGVAWYPQVTDGAGNHTRGTGTIAVTTSANRMPVMAASTVTTNNGTYTFHYAQPDIFSLYIGNYTRQEYKGQRSFYTYSLSNGVDGNNLSRKSAAVLDYLSSQFGPLDIPNFSIIEYPDYVAEITGIGGASILGGVAMPTGALREFNYALFGHEIGHQWWGNKVLSAGSKGEEMLSEGLAQYGSLQVVSHFDSAHAMEYRRTGYPGYISDQCGLGYLKNVAAGNDEALVSLSGNNGHTIGDSKGFLALELLSNTVGKPVFHKALRTIGDQYSRSGITWDNFQMEVEKVHGSSLQWFYSQWFERLGAPSWQSSWQQQQNKLQLTIMQKDSIYQLPLEVLIRYNNGSTSLQRITIHHRNSQLQLPIEGAVKAVQIDPYFKVLHWDEALTPEAFAQAKVVRVLNLRRQQKNEEAMKLAQSYIKEGFPDDQYGVEYTLLYHMGRIAAMQNKPAEALAYYQRALQCVSRAPDLLAYTYYRIARLAAAQNDDTLMQWAAANALKADAARNKPDGMEAKVAELLSSTVAKSK
jgi:tetratricopeptide (TPR) repeat protein